jgi:hypothetical protein
MAANFKTIDKVVEILIDEVNLYVALRMLRRLEKETVPSGNSSYDATIKRLLTALEKL